MDSSEQLRQARLEFYEQDVDEVNGILSDFLDASQAKCILLVDREGHLVTKKGFTKSFDTTSLSALVAASFASTKAMAEVLGETSFLTLSHQGKSEHIHIALVGGRALLVIVFDDRTNLGMVRLYAGEVTNRVAEALKKADERIRQQGAPQKLEADFEAAAEQRLDDFFGQQ
jgi:predicted regulator of Ras-like GTPase activity (Roadblock/LC7/MglB family)